MIKKENCYYIVILFFDEKTKMTPYIAHYVNCKEN